MKITNRNSALHFLLENDPIECYANDDDEGASEALSFLQSEFPKQRSIFGKKIQYITNPFMNAYKKGAEKLDKIFIQEPIDQSGTLIIPHEKFGNYTIFYQLSGICNAAGKWSMYATIMSFYSCKQLEFPKLLSIVSNLNSARKHLVYLAKDLKVLGETENTILAYFSSMAVFIKYCEVEVKLVSPGVKAHHVNQKYVNDTDFPVEILDSTWFTTIVRSEGFSVGSSTGGFFRLQPFGPGLKQKKLIWIFPFEKHGYIREAKVSKNGK